MVITCERCNLREADRVLRGTRVSRRLSDGEIWLEVIRHNLCGQCAATNLAAQPPSKPAVAERVFTVSARVEYVSESLVNVAVGAGDGAVVDETWKIRREIMPQLIQEVGLRFTISGTDADFLFLRGEVP